MKQTQTVEELQTERTKVRGEINRKMEQARTVPTSDLGKIALEIAQLQAQEKLIVANLDVLDSLNRQAKEAQEIAAKKKRADEVDKTLDWAGKTRFLCPKCERQLKFSGARRPNGSNFSGVSWKETNPPVAYLISLRCYYCSSEVLRSPAELQELAKTSADKPEGKKRLALMETWPG
jgi:hypothetical protein